MGAPIGWVNGMLNSSFGNKSKHVAVIVSITEVITESVPISWLLPGFSRLPKVRHKGTYGTNKG